MKTIRLILSIAGFAFTSAAFAQVQPQDNNDVLFYTANYNLSSNRVEHHINQYPARKTSGDQFEAPFLNRTFFVPLELDTRIEAWMISPFETSIYEEGLQIESWMESPFESSYYEPDTPLEQWMCNPFVPDDEIEVEDWMTTPWI